MDESLMGHRTRFLSVLCGLSMVNGLYGLLSGLVSAIAPVDVDGNYLESLYAQIDKFNLPMEGIRPSLEEYYLNIMLNLGNMGAANFLFYGIGAVGVLLMFRLNRIGFVLYVLAQLGLAFTPAVFGGFNMFGQVSLCVSLTWNAVWVGMYATQLKHFYS